jgi:predicted permease
MTWWRRLVGRSTLERQLDAELRDHLERQVTDYIRDGMSAPDARRRAALEFGGLEQIREQCRDARGTRVVEDGLRDVRYACRTLVKRPGYAVAALLLLGLGIGANTAIFSLLDAVLFRTVPVASPDALYFIAHRHGERTHAASNYPLLQTLRDRNDVFTGVTAYAMTTFKVANGDDVDRVPGEYVAGNYHSLVGARLAIGRGFTAESDRPSTDSDIAVISDRYWARAFNRAPDIIGRRLDVDGRSLSIVGVTAAGFDGFTPGRPADVTLPLALKVVASADYLTMHDTWTSLVMLARLKPGESASRAGTVVDTLVRQYLAAPENAWYKLDATVLQPAGRGTGELRARYSATLTVLMAMVVLVLVIALANFALLQLARGTARAKEMSIRLSIGAGRWRLVRQLVTESLILSLAGGGIGWLLAAWGTSTIAVLFRGGQNPVILDVQASGLVFAFTAVVTIVAGLVFGLGPALAATRVDLVSSLKEVAPLTGPRRARWNVRWCLVAGQVAVCLLLIVGAALLTRTLRNLQAPDGSFNARGVTLFAIEGPEGDPVDGFWPTACVQFLDRLSQLGGIAASTCSTSTPVDQTESRRGAVVGTTPINGGVLANVASEGFFRTFGVPLVKGRLFTPQDATSGFLVGVINETLARAAFGDGDPIGRTLHFRAAPTQKISIVGIVRDVRHNPWEPASPTVYTPLGQGGEIEGWMTVAVRSASAAPMAVDTVRSAIRSVRPDVVVTRARTFGDQMSGLLARERALALLSGWFGILALVLACVGLYGVMSYDVTRRRRELGIRLALGAEPSTVLGGVLRDAALLAATGIVIGVAGAWLTSKLITGLLFDISARDPLTLVGAAGVLALTTLTAAYLPARRASRVDPTTVLRSS